MKTKTLNQLKHENGTLRRLLKELTWRGDNNVFTQRCIDCKMVRFHMDSCDLRRTLGPTADIEEPDDVTSEDPAT